MKRFTLTLALLLLLSSTFAFSRISVVEATGTICIRPDGTVDPPTAPIQRDGDFYTFTDDIYDSIVVKRDNVVINGDGYAVQGSREYGTRGIDLSFRDNVTIKNVKVTNSYWGIYLFYSSSVIISGNVVTNNSRGILLYWNSFDNTLSNNTITGNEEGVVVEGSWHNTLDRNSIMNNEVGVLLNSASEGVTGDSTLSRNTIANNSVGIDSGGGSSDMIYHNNLVDNIRQIDGSDITDFWDYGYPSGGNYWSDYDGTDMKNGLYQNETGSDGIGDTDYIIDANNRDRYPLMGPFNTFNVGSWNNVSYYVDIVSNATISDFNFDVSQRLISFNVTGNSSTIGFSRVTINNVLLGGPYTVWVDTTPITPSITSDGTNSFLYFTCNHSTKNAKIIGTTAIPEYQSIIILPLFMIATLLAVIVYRRKRLQQA